MMHLAGDGQEEVCGERCTGALSAPQQPPFQHSILLHRRRLVAEHASLILERIEAHWRTESTVCRCVPAKTLTALTMFSVAWKTACHKPG